MPLRGLTIVVAEAAPARFRVALTMAAAQAALGGAAHIFLESAAVALLKPPIVAPDDAAHAAAGLPTLATLLDEAIALGVGVTACQSGLALCGVSAGELRAGVAFGGMVSIIAAIAEDRLVVI